MTVFYHGNMRFDVPDGVYYPREDSLLLEKSAGKEMKGKKVLEIGSGCGFLSILMSKAGAHVTAVDINPDAVAITKSNAERNGVMINCFVSDLFDNVNDAFDMIVFNPPYLPDDDSDITYSGGATGRTTIEKFLTAIRNYLNPNGFVLLLISSLTGEKEVLELMRKNGLNAKVVARQKVPWEELIVVEGFQ